MNFSSVLKRFNWGQLMHLAALMIRNPILVFPVFRATQQTMRICNTLYGKKHHLNGKENAFRHAIWNVLLCQRIDHYLKNSRKSIIWTKNITELHEKLAPNSVLETAMDIHNNELGRDYFEILKDAEEDEVILFLKGKISNAKLISKLDDINLYKDVMLYIEDEKVI